MAGERDAVEDELRDAAFDAFMAFWRGTGTEQATFWAAYCAAQECYDAYLARIAAPPAEARGNWATRRRGALLLRLILLVAGQRTSMVISHTADRPLTPDEETLQILHQEARRFESVVFIRVARDDILYYRADALGVEP